MVNSEDEQTPPPLFEKMSFGYVSNSFIALSFLNTLLVITTTLGNVLIVLALRKKSSIYPPSRLLLRSLAFTDLCVGLISQPLAALHAISILTKHLRIHLFTVVSSYATSAVLSGVSLFILTFISVDRLLALSLGVRYRQTVTIERVRAFVIFSWVLSIANGVALLLWNKFIFYIVCVTAIFLCVATSTFCYTKIYYILRLQQIKVHVIGLQRQPSESSSINLRRYKKTVSSALWVHFTLLACYLPFSVVSGMKAITGETFAVAEGFTATLVFFNSSLNPVLYCWRIGEVRQAVKETIREYFGFPSEA
ncbi:putative G-protein coupled receptor 45 [Oculina patagonica]